MIMRWRCDDCASRHFMANASAIGEKCLPKSARVDVEVFGIELDAHQEQAGLFVAVLVGVQDVAVVPVNEVGDGGDFALAVRTGDEQDGGILHGL